MTVGRHLVEQLVCGRGILAMICAYSSALGAEKFAPTIESLKQSEGRT